MQNNLRNVPFFRLLVPLVVGICLGFISSHWVFPVEPNLWITLVLLSLLFYSIVISRDWGSRWVFGVACYLFLVATGFVLTHNAQRHKELNVDNETHVLVKLLSPPDQRANTYRILARVEAIRDGDSWRYANQKLMIYFRSADSTVANLKYGEVIAISTKLRHTPQPQNPFQFNYSAYLARRGVHYTAFVATGQWHSVGVKGSRIISLSYRLRDKLMELFIRSSIRDENLAVASALTMGYKNLLDEETRRVFAASGAMHILAVSGLHVGILFLITSQLLFFFDRIPKGRYLKAVVIILLLWLYALFTGMSPSVMRASLMFSFIVAGRAINRRTNIYNTICASAFVLLCINPMLLMEVGFQLSYLAVISIVFFYPYIYRMVYVPNWLIDKVWSLISVSVAAQIGAFGLGAFYFNQFPVYFLFTNLYAIPLATGIIYASILLVILSPLWFIGQWVGAALNALLSLLNWLTSATEALPFSTISGIVIQPLQLLLLIGGIVLIAAFLELKRGYILAIALGAFAVLFTHRELESIHAAKQQELVVFSTGADLAIGFTEGKHFVFVHSDSTGLCPFVRNSYNIHGYINKRGLSRHKQSLRIGDNFQTPLLPSFASCTSPLGQWFHFAGRTMVLLTCDELSNYTASKPIEVDVLVINSSARVRVENILMVYSPQIVVIDASVSPSLADFLGTFFASMGIRAHQVGRDGAFVLGV